MTRNRALPEIGTHGGDIREIARNLGIAPEDLLDFSTNCNVFAHDLTRELVDSTPYDFAAYPENHGARLLARIADHENAPENQIVIGNGSAELIFLALRAMNPGSALLIGPIFSGIQIFSIRFIETTMSGRMTGRVNNYQLSVP